MSGQHTPGPWAVYADGRHIVGPENGFMPFGGCGCCGSPWMNGDNDITQMADARLIAAAPDLLAALEAAYAFIADQYCYTNHPDGLAFSEEAQPTIDIIVDAITKATGQ